ncbi:Tad domain-containing protein [Paenibacillus azoreducens]|uniref:Uncharacterized protein n=1 Tax=Paenibacillus azoreducens TaxID=116718 RepID=A0A919YH19_9BACL|nr:Tad domain-containing protein [Paenibacillus azoreducens]GIO48247.1 hypothetical protein J34TS1_30120 [Paenibacillus azoreducens]
MFAKRRPENGSVSVFLIMILAFIFAFVALFIDYSRIAALKVQSERLAHAAVRSVMSSYDPELQERYGLFAYGSHSGDQIMASVLNSSMEKGKRSDRFNVLPLELDSSGLKMDRMLGEYDIFNRGIGEEMKYKAPIDFTLEILSKFKPLSSSMKEASNTFDVLRKLQKLYDKREAALDLMLAKQKKAAQSASGIAGLLMDSYAGSIPNESLGSSRVTTGAAIAAQYDDYVSKVNEDANRGEDEKPKYGDEISAYLTNSAEIWARLGNRQSSAAESHSRLLQEAREDWKEACDLNEQMKQVIASAENRVESTGYDVVSAGGIPGISAETSGDDSETIRGLRGETDKLLLSDNLLGELKDEIDRQENESHTANRSVSEASSALAAATGPNGSSASMKYAVISARGLVDEYLRAYADPGSANRLDQAAGRLEQHRASDKQRKEKEKKSKAKLKDAANILERIKELDKKAKRYMEEYKKLQTYYEESLDFNKQQADGNHKGADMDSDPYDAGKSAMNGMDGLYGAMAGMMNGVRDELLQNEYAALYFKHFDISILKDAAKNPQAKLGDAVVDQLSVSNQELEYILYGFHNPVGNVSAAYAEIFASRLAIRTMEGLVKNSGLGHPLLVLAAAVLYGIEMAIADMITLCETGAVELSSYVKVKITYRDYLRLFLLIHSNNEKKMSRMLALIRFNTGINPAERATYASGEVKIGMKLWFLPGVMKMVGYAGGHPDEVEGNRYYAVKQADYSY